MLGAYYLLNFPIFILTHKNPIRIDVQMVSSFTNEDHVIYLADVR